MILKLTAAASLLSALYTSAFADSGRACNYAGYFICVETTDDQYLLNCDEGSTVQDSCKVEGRFATCAIPSGPTIVNARFYTGYTGNAKADCDDAGGVYSEGR